ISVGMRGKRFLIQGSQVDLIVFAESIGEAVALEAQRIGLELAVMGLLLLGLPGAAGGLQPGIERFALAALLVAGSTELRCLALSSFFVEVPLGQISLGLQHHALAFFPAGPGSR